MAFLSHATARHFVSLGTNTSWSYAPMGSRGVGAPAGAPKIATGMGFCASGGMGQNYATRKYGRQVLVHVSIDQGSILGTYF